MMMKHATEQSSGSGTAIDFTGIPAGTTMVIIGFVAVSHNGAAGGMLRVQLGSGGALDTTANYHTSAGIATTTPNVTIGGGVTNQSSMSITHNGSGAAAVLSGSIILTLQDQVNNGWNMIAIMGRVDSTVSSPNWSAGYKGLSAALDRVRISDNAGNSFDAGSINIAYF